MSFLKCSLFRSIYIIDYLFFIFFHIQKTYLKTKMMDVRFCQNHRLNYASLLKKTNTNFFLHLYKNVLHFENFRIQIFDGFTCLRGQKIQKICFYETSVCESRCYSVKTFVVAQSQELMHGISQKKFIPWDVDIN